MVLPSASCSARRGCGAACSCWYCSGDAALSVPLPLMPHRCRYPDCACVGAVLSCVRLCCVLGRGASSLRFYPWITAALLSRRKPTMPSQPQMSSGEFSQNHFLAFTKVGPTGPSITHQPGGSVLQMALTEPGVATSEPAFSRKEELKKAKLRTTSVWYKLAKQHAWRPLPLAKEDGNAKTTSA